MVLPPSPARIRRAVGGVATRVVRRLLGIEVTPSDAELTKVPDDLPRDMLFEQPLVCSVTTPEPESRADGGTRVSFKVVVRDAAGKRCPDLAVDAAIAGPERTAEGQVTTSMLGVATFRMTGPPGTYALTVTDVAAHALTWDAEASTTTAEVVVPAA